jgi:glutamate synthase (NADPH) large chain
VSKGLLKVMSKMGISTYQSYCGAQIFDAVGLRSSFVKKYFTGTHTQVEGVGLRTIARETVERHRQAFGNVPALANDLEVGGDYAYRIRGEAHSCSMRYAATCRTSTGSTRSRSTTRTSS